MRIARVWSVRKVLELDAGLFRRPALSIAPGRFDQCFGQRCHAVEPFCLSCRASVEFDLLQCHRLAPIAIGPQRGIQNCPRLVTVAEQWIGRHLTHDRLAVTALYDVRCLGTQSHFTECFRAPLLFGFFQCRGRIRTRNSRANRHISRSLAAAERAGAGEPGTTLNVMPLLRGARVLPAYSRRGSVAMRAIATRCEVTFWARTIFGSRQPLRDGPCLSR